MTTESTGASGQPAAAPAPTPQNARAVIQHNLRSARATESTTQPQTERAPVAGRGAAATPSTTNFDPTSDPNEPAGDELAGGDEELGLETDEVEAVVEDLLERELHGHKGRAILEALANGSLPLELLAQVKATAKVNGQDVAVTLAEALAGYQRASDYTRGKKQLRAESQQMHQRLSAVSGMLDSWTTGDALLGGMRRLGKMEAFHQAAIAYARDQWDTEQLRQQNPAAYAAKMEARREREQREALEQRLQRQPQQQSGPSERQTAQLAEQLEQLVAPAFDAHGIKGTPFARERFADNFRALYDEDADLGAIVQAAAQATAEELGDLAERYNKQQGAAGATAKPNPSPLPARQQAAPTTAPRPTQKRMNPTQMEAFLAQRRKQSHG